MYTIILIPLEIDLSNKNQNHSAKFRSKITLEKFRNKFHLNGGYLKLKDSTTTIIKSDILLDHNTYYYVPPLPHESIGSLLFRHIFDIPFKIRNFTYPETSI